MNRNPDPSRSLGARIAAMLVWCALVLQFFLTATLVTEQGRGLLAGLEVFLSFFTILTNLLVATTLTVPLLAARTRLATFFAAPVLQGAIATYIAAVGIAYSLLLRHLRPSEPLAYLADVGLHDVIPVTFVVYWWIVVPKGGLRWRHAVLWLSYPLVYVIYALLRGAVIGRYPYWFLDAGLHGYARVFANMALLTVGFLIIGLIFVAVDRGLRRRRSREGVPS